MMKKYVKIGAIVIGLLLLIQCSEFIFKELVWEFFDDYIQGCTIDEDDWTYLIAGITIDLSLVHSAFKLADKFITLRIKDRKERKES